MTEVLSGKRSLIRTGVAVSGYRRQASEQEAKDPPASAEQEPPCESEVAAGVEAELSAAPASERLTRGSGRRPEFDQLLKDAGRAAAEATPHSTQTCR